MWPRRHQIIKSFDIAMARKKLRHVRRPAHQHGRIDINRAHGWAKNERPLAQRFGKDVKVPLHVFYRLGLDGVGMARIGGMARRIIHAQIRHVDAGGEVKHPAQIAGPQG